MNFEFESFYPHLIMPYNGLEQIGNFQLSGKMVGKSISNASTLSGRNKRPQLLCNWLGYSLQSEYRVLVSIS